MANDIHILVAEDDTAIATGLGMNLELEGYSVQVIGDGQDALDIVTGDTKPDLVLLDIGLPRCSGLEILSALREQGIQVPVIVLSARHSETDKVVALRLGADDYVTKPFALAELLARIAALLRRIQSLPSTSTLSSIDAFGDIEVDRQKRTLTKSGADAALTHLEFELLLYFLDHPNEVLDRQVLLREVWGTSGSRRTVDNFVGLLRAKLEDDPEAPTHFVTVRGSGYRFSPTPKE